MRLISAHARLREGEGSAVYVSGDQRATAELLLQLGVAPERVAGDSCARTTWESATLTSAWLQQQHPAPAPPAPSSSRSNGASGSSLPQWRSFLSTLNWRRDPGYEQRM